MYRASYLARCTEKSRNSTYIQIRDKHNATNYRLISLISNIEKVFEKIIYNRIYELIKKRNIITDQHFGFMKKIGTKDALNYITNILYNNLDHSKPTLITF